jgi:hypothetical protein
MKVDHLVLAIQGDPEGAEQNLFLDLSGSFAL